MVVRAQPARKGKGKTVGKLPDTSASALASLTTSLLVTHNLDYRAKETKSRSLRRLPRRSARLLSPTNDFALSFNGFNGIIDTQIRRPVGSSRRRRKLSDPKHLGQLANPLQVLRVAFQVSQPKKSCIQYILKFSI